MTRRPQNIAILGSTGSIGTSALEVIAAAPESMRAWAISAHKNTRLALEQARQFRPRYLAVADAEAAAATDWSTLPAETELLLGPDSLSLIAAHDDADIVLAAIVGSAGLQGAWAAIEKGKRVALANKETLVVGGQLFTQHAAKHGAEIIPVDSEHSAIFQALRSGAPTEVERIVLTASGGPFRNFSLAELASVTPQQALRHPVWEMGRKITIDSATMMNKALEVIEARWLFDLAAEQIAVMIHPQSIVHSLVEFVDGSVLAQLSPPDMRLPIQYAFTYPARTTGVARRMDWTRGYNLEFTPPDLNRFPALQLGWDVARAGGTAGAVLNAANESAVAGFLDGELAFTEIVEVCREILEQHPFESQPTLARLLELDQWAREEVRRWVCT